MLEKDIFTAKEAREYLENNTSNLINKQLRIVCNNIKERIDRGFNYLEIDTSKIIKFYITTPNLENKLHELGYKVTFHTSQKDGDYLKLEW